MPKTLFVTDLDQTLLDSQAQVPAVCLDAIRSYVDQGGLFTVATGRPTRGVLLYPELTKLINAPVITYNGACIYDLKHAQVLSRRLLPERIVPLLRSALNQFPSVGALIFRGDDDVTCAVRSNTYIREITWNRERYDAPERPLEENPLPWNKAVLAGPPEEMVPCADYIRANASAFATVILSEGTFLEIIGPGTGKGTALRKLAEMLGIQRNQVIAAGDSMNDLEMLLWAGTGIAVANAEDPVRQAASLVTASNTEFGVGVCLRDTVMKMLL